MARSGIYKITNIVSKKIYIGSACNYETRKNTHLHELRNKNHGNDKLQKSFNKHGESCFIFEMIEECDRESLLLREQYFIDTINPFYNICKIAGSSLGIKRSQSFCEKQKKLKNKLGKRATSDQKINMSVYQKKRHEENPNLKEIYRERLKGNTYCRGKKFTQERIKSMSGENSYACKLTDKQVLEIRKLFKPFDFNYSARKLAKVYGVSHQTISSVANFKHRKITTNE